MHCNDIERNEAASCVCEGSLCANPVYTVIQKKGVYGLYGRCKSLSHAVYSTEFTQSMADAFARKFTETALCPIHVEDAVIDLTTEMLLKA